MLSTAAVGVVLAASMSLSSAAVDRKAVGFGAHRLHQNTIKRNNLKGEGSSTTCDNVEEYYFKDAVIDNFAPIQNQEKWVGKGQRYWMNKEFWSGPGAPIFVYIGGEGQESCRHLSPSMFIHSLAEKHNALLVNVEHRFYGESYPTADMSTENLQYLSSSQALADLARVVGQIKSDLGSESSKVVTAGGSYPGNLAAWFRLKYPSVTDGSIASSAPLTAQTNFPEYMDVVGQALIYYGGQSCFDAFEEAADAVQNLINDGPGSQSWAKLAKDFSTCSPIETEQDMAVMLSDLMGNVQGTIQYNNEVSTMMNADAICSKMAPTPSSTPYDKFVELSADYRVENGVECEDASWAATLEWLTPIEKDPNNVGRPWTYQTCNEFGFFQTTDSVNQPFHSWKSLNMAFYDDMCKAGFNFTVEPQVEFINQMYGDINIQGTNTALVAGTIDPWHALGVTNYTTSSLQESEVPVYILGTAHCADMSAPSENDPAPLVQAHEDISAQVEKWLK